MIISVFVVIPITIWTIVPLRLFKSFVKSGSLGTTNSSQLTEADTIFEQFIQHFSRCCSTEAETFVNTFPLVTSRHKFEIEFKSININQTITSLKKPYDDECDGVPVSFVKYGSTRFPVLYLKLFNLSLDCGHYPYVWKTSLITLRFKTGLRTDIVNCMFINLTSTLSRTMVKIIHKWILSFILSSSLIGPFQHGFITKRSCFTSYLEFFYQITRGQILVHQW